MLPLFIVMLVYADNDRERALAAARDRVSLLVGIAAETQGQLIGRTRDALRFLAGAAEVRSGGSRCDAFLARFIAVYPWITELRVSGLDGAGLCASRPEVQRHNVADRAFFQRVMAGDELAVSDMPQSRASGVPKVIAAVPMRDGSRIKGVVSAAIELQVFGALLARTLEAEPNTSAEIIDRNGLVIARYPPAADGSEDDPRQVSELRAILDAPAGVVDLPQSGGSRLLAFRRLPETDATVAVSAKQASIIDPIEEANRQRLALISGIFLLSVLTGLVGGEALILGPLRALASTTRALQGGDLRARTRLVGVGEVGLLARALDGMAAAVEDRERQLREAREAAEQARQEAEEASQAKSEFLATMSHEIRTPLTGIVGYAELLRNGRLSAQQRRHLDRLDASASALSTVVDDVLNFSRLEAGQVEIEPRPFLLPALLDNAVSIVRTIADKKGLPIKIELDPALPKVVIGDEARLRQVLLNLLNNAVKFTAKGQVTLRVDPIGADESCNQFRFSVIDTGIGIPRDQRNRLFLRFAQIGHSTAAQYGGSGLGLAISKRLIELMGGIIGVESEEGRGSTFWIVLTLPPGEAGVAHRMAAPPRKAARAARILVADDLEMNRELVCSMLEGVGHQVDAASDAAEAIEAVKTKSYDLVLMDIRMRELTSGVMATREIRRLPPPAGHVPIIAMSANVLPQQVREFKQAGMNDHLGKPFTWAQLLAKIAPYLPDNRSQARGAAPAPDEVPSFDPQAYHAMTKLLGEERAQAWVERLKEQLESIVGHGDAAGADQERLARLAHGLVSQAGSIGFRAVSRAAGELEQTCLAQEDLKKPLGRLKAASRKALDQLPRLPGFSRHDQEGVTT